MIILSRARVPSWTRRTRLHRFCVAVAHPQIRTRRIVFFCYVPKATANDEDFDEAVSEENRGGDDNGEEGFPHERVAIILWICVVLVEFRSALALSRGQNVNTENQRAYVQTKSGNVEFELPMGLVTAAILAHLDAPP